jgi:hypothetical protein
LYITYKIIVCIGDVSDNAPEVITTYCPLRTCHQHRERDVIGEARDTRDRRHLGGAGGGGA